MLPTLRPVLRPPPDEEEPLPTDGRGNWEPMQAHDSYVVCFYGRRNAGKSAVQCAISKEAQDIIDARGLPQKVLTNTPYRFLAARGVVGEIEALACEEEHRHTDDCYRVEAVGHYHPRMWGIARKLPDWGRGGIVIVDELTDVASIWSTMSHDVRATVRGLRQIRKNRSDVLGATQFPERISGPVAEQIDVLALCESITPRGKPPEYVRVSLYRPDKEALPPMYSWQQPPIRQEIVRVGHILDEYDTYYKVPEGGASG